MTFSQRMGLVKVRDMIQVESLDTETRNAIWNLIVPVMDAAGYKDSCPMFQDIWTGLYQKASDTVPRDSGRMYDNRTDSELYRAFFRGKIIEGAWYECLDLVEYLADSYNRERWNPYFYDSMFHQQNVSVPSGKVFNVIFEVYMVGYRFIGDELTPITNAQELDSIENAIKDSGTSTQELLEKALVHLSNRKRPDYAKSVECSISAVEAQCRILLKGQQVSLGQALKALDRRGYDLHPALKGAFEKLYGFTSNADGIRHAGIKPSDVDQTLAKYMLVVCSAFVNYLIAKGGVDK